MMNNLKNWPLFLVSALSFALAGQSLANGKVDEELLYSAVKQGVKSAQAPSRNVRNFERSDGKAAETNAVQRFSRRAGTLVEPVEDIKPVVIRTRNGVNQAIRISEFELNLLQTPFKDPMVIDGGGIDTQVVGSNLFVKVSEGGGNRRQSIFISDSSDPRTVISITLIPEDIPAQTVTFVLDKHEQKTAIGEERKPSSSYVSGVVDLLREAASNSRIDGFTEVDIRNERAKLGPVTSYGVKRLSGSDQDIYIYRLVNEGGEGVTLSEPGFYQKGVRAVSMEPRISLMPSELTYVYILMDKVIGE